MKFLNSLFLLISFVLLCSCSKNYTEGFQDLKFGQSLKEVQHFEQWKDGKVYDNKKIVVEGYKLNSSIYLQSAVAYFDNGKLTSVEIYIYPLDIENIKKILVEKYGNAEKIEDNNSRHYWLNGSITLSIYDGGAFVAYRSKEIIEQEQKEKEAESKGI